MHPCRPCGACCAHLPVSFHADHLTRVLADQVEPARARDHVTMRRRDDGACVALHGDPGARTACSIYPDRPPPCRDFEPSWESGRANLH